MTKNNRKATKHFFFMGIFYGKIVKEMLKIPSEGLEIQDNETGF